MLLFICFVRIDADAPRLNVSTPTTGITAAQTGNPVAVSAHAGEENKQGFYRNLSKSHNSSKPGKNHKVDGRKEGRKGGSGGNWTANNQKASFTARSSFTNSSKRHGGSLSKARSGRKGGETSGMQPAPADFAPGLFEGLAGGMGVVIAIGAGFVVMDWLMKRRLTKHEMQRLGQSDET